jgi:hypothetical protein
MTSQLSSCDRDLVENQVIAAGNESTCKQARAVARGCQRIPWRERPIIREAVPGIREAFSWSGGAGPRTDSAGRSSDQRARGFSFHTGILEPSRLGSWAEIGKALWCRVGATHHNPRPDGGLHPHYGSAAESCSQSRPMSRRLFVDASTVLRFRPRYRGAPRGAVFGRDRRGLGGPQGLRSVVSRSLRITGMGAGSRDTPS